MIYTTIIHPVRIELDITPYEYMLADIIFRSQGNPAYSVNGWCTINFNVIANFIGVSKRTIMNAAKNLKKLDILKMEGNKKRVTKKWHEAFTKVQKLHPKSADIALSNTNPSPTDSASFSPQKVQKLHLKGANVAHINRRNRIKSNNTSSPKVEEASKEEEHFLEYSNFDVTNQAQDEKKKVAPKKKRQFAESHWGVSLDSFMEKFSTIAPQADFPYYHNRIKTWSAEKQVSLTDEGWISVVQRFIKSDQSKGQLIKSQPSTEQVATEGMPSHNTKIF